jgi:hypothetical protein
MKEFGSYTPMKRAAQPEEIAPAFLLHRALGYFSIFMLVETDDSDIGAFASK